jgi:predicted transposase YdaD
MLGLESLKQTRVYQEALEEGRQEGRQEGREVERRQMIVSILETRFGSLDESLAAIVDPLLALPSDQVIPLLLRCSREELVAQFSR